MRPAGRSSWMGLLRRQSGISIAFLVSLVVLALLYVFTAKATLPETAGAPANTGPMDANSIDLRDLKPADFDPSMVVGRFFVESTEDPAVQVLLAQNKKIIARSQLPEKTRVIPEGHFVTMDYVEDRFNIYIRQATNEVYKAKFG